MLRRVVPFLVGLLVLASGSGLVAAEDEDPRALQEMPSPSRVAAWVVSEEAADLKRAVHALTGAPPAYVADVVREIRRLRKPLGKPLGKPVEIETAAPVPDADTILLEARIYALGRGGTRRHLGEGRVKGSHVLEKGEGDALRAALEREEGVEILSSPSLLVGDRQWGTVEIASPVSYVRDVRVERRGDVYVQDPVIDVLDAGFVLEVRPVVSADERFVTLSGALTHTGVSRPIPTRRIQLEGGLGTAEVQAPTLKETKLDLHVTLPDGSYVVGTGLTHPSDAEREVLVLLRVQRVGAGETVAPPAVPESAWTRVVTIQVRLLSATEEVLARVLGSSIPDADNPLRALEAAEVVRLLGPGRRGVAGVTVLSAPRLTTHDGQRASISVLNQTSYVKDFEVVKDGDRVILDPVIDTLQDGLVFEATPTINEDRTRIAFDTLTTWAVLTRPIAELTTRLEGQEATIQIPELNVNRVRREFELEAGAYALLGGLTAGRDGRRAFVLLTASVTALDDEVKDFIGGGKDLTPR